MLGSQIWEECVNNTTSAISIQKIMLFWPQLHDKVILVRENTAEM